VYGLDVVIQKYIFCRIYFNQLCKHWS